MESHYRRELVPVFSNKENRAKRVHCRSFFLPACFLLLEFFKLVSSKPANLFSLSNLRDDGLLIFRASRLSCRQNMWIRERLRLVTSSMEFLTNLIQELPYTVLSHFAWTCRTQISFQSRLSSFAKPLTTWIISTYSLRFYRQDEIETWRKMHKPAELF